MTNKVPGEKVRWGRGWEEVGVGEGEGWEGVGGGVEGGGGWEGARVGGGEGGRGEGGRGEVWWRRGVVEARCGGGEVW